MPGKDCRAGPVSSLSSPGKRVFPLLPPAQGDDCSPNCHLGCYKYRQSGSAVFPLAQLRSNKRRRLRIAHFRPFRHYPDLQTTPALPGLFRQHILRIKGQINLQTAPFHTRSPLPLLSRRPDCRSGTVSWATRKGILSKPD